MIQFWQLTINVCCILALLLGFVDAYNLLILPVSYLDGINMVEAFGLLLISSLPIIRSLDVTSAINRDPRCNRFSDEAINLLVSVTKLILYLSVFAWVHLWHWIIN